MAKPAVEHRKKSAGQELDFPVVGIGASAGGLKACTELIGSLPEEPGMALVLVQHLDPSHKSILPDLISHASRFPVLKVRDGMEVKPNHLYVIPENTILSIREEILRLLPRETARGTTMPIDVFFRSLAQDRASRAIGVILSGTASDGALGIEAIKAEGGITFAQDEQSAGHPGMPKSAAATGCVDFILPPAKIARELVRIGRHPYVTQPAPPSPPPLPSDDDGALAEIFRILHAATGTNFSRYKRTTVHRRILRRMAVHKVDRLEAYVDRLRETPDEARALRRELLIGVTNFFRDPDAFEALKKQVFPTLLRGRSPEEPIRIWVPGCSTGEEACSIAISLLESIGEKTAPFPIQIFATDVNESSLEKGRNGSYIENISNDVSPERLSRWFTRQDGRYRIRREIRDMCVFAKQDFTSDPPFSKIDLISCRNVLMYFDPSLQKRGLSVFHYALKPGGFLFLGSSETTSAAGGLFNTVDKKQKLFTKSTAVARTPPPLPASGPSPRKPLPPRPDAPPGKKERRDLDIPKEADRILLTQYVPACVLVNDALEIQQFRGDTSLYLAPSPGKASLNLLQVAREGLLAGLRAAIAQAKEKGTTVVREGLSVRYRGETHEAAVQVVPIPERSSSGTCFLVLFEEKPWEREIPAHEQETSEERDERSMAQLRRELAATQTELQSMLREYEAGGEELKAANEELLSANEELQSTNEELETSKEELESANEELMTMNEEIQNRNAELHRHQLQLEGARDYARAIVETVREPLVVLDPSLKTLSANQAFYQTFQASPETTENRRIYELGDGQWDIPDLRALLDQIVSGDTAFTDFEVEHEFPGIGRRAMLLNARRVRKEELEIDAILLAIEDVTERKQAKEQLNERDAELARSNQELEQFAQVASHDLQEPLRMISSFGDLLKKKYMGKIDAGADKAITYMTDGAHRLQEMIGGLLTYARAGAQDAPLVPVDCNEAFSQARAALKLTLEENDVDLACEELPTVPGNPAQLSQLFQNLISNAVKYRGAEPPRIRVSAKRRENEWLFSVRDNGIGIDPESFERIFRIFQRLHTRESLPGSGVGLSLCKKIVERHGGRIWVESEPDQGSTFLFTIPAPDAQ